MQGRIAINDKGEHGFLQIKRPQGWTTCQCPFQTVTHERKSGGLVCGDWCPLFGDVVELGLDPGKAPYTELKLCHRTLYFDDFKDLRK
jgi:hypothetical protein